ncbi:MAG: glutaredoxin family protein [Chloroflexota bacterium]|nr:glutaredoxin family protein [Chloroflexota bacterium]
MAVEHVAGKNIGSVMLYALSTCSWCRKTRNLLEEMGVEYDYEYVDLLPEAERKETLKNMERWNSSRSFPTMVINGKVIVGFDEPQIRQAVQQ